MLSLDTIPLNDKNTIEFLCNPKNNKALFQFRSKVSQQYLKTTMPILKKKFSEALTLEKIKITSSGEQKKIDLENMFKRLAYNEETDVLNLLAIVQTIIRPANRNSGTSDRLINKMLGKKGKDSDLPIKKNTYFYNQFCLLTHDTFEECIYQEQFMQILNKFFKLNNLGLADDYRRIFENKKKKKEELKELKNKFWNLYKHEESVEVIKEFWIFLEKLGEYGFNKSHAIGYAMLSYFTAYFLANYPKYYLSACIGRCKDDQKEKAFEKIEALVNDSRDLGVEVVLPVVNKSYSKPTPSKDLERIYLSVSIVGGIGDVVSENIALKNDFNSLKEFLDWSSKQMTITINEDGVKRSTKIYKKNIYELLTAIGFFKPFYEGYDFDVYYDSCIDYINNHEIQKIETREKKHNKKTNKYHYELKSNKTVREEMYEDKSELTCKVRVFTPLLKDKIEKRKKINKFKLEFELLKFILSNVFEKHLHLNKSANKIIKINGDKVQIIEKYLVFMVKKTSSGKSKFYREGELPVYTKISGISSEVNTIEDFYINGKNVSSKYKYGDIVYVKFHIFNGKYVFQDIELIERLL